MAGYFKRRPAPGPSKNEQKVSSRRDADSRAKSAEALGHRYPTVQKMTIKLQFVSPQQHVIDQQTRAYNPQDQYDFSVPCPGRCGDGAFDLAAKIDGIVEKREPMSESSGACQKPLYAGAAEVCGLQLKCRIEVQYLPLAQPQA